MAKRKLPIRITLAEADRVREAVRRYEHEYPHPLPGTTHAADDLVWTLGQIYNDAIVRLLCLRRAHRQRTRTQPGAPA